MAFHAKLIIQRQPCTACVIINSLNKETLERVLKQRSDFTFDTVVIDRPDELAQIEGVEVEKMPIVLVNEEQISAGSILSPKMLNQMLENML